MKLANQSAQAARQEVNLKPAKNQDQPKVTINAAFLAEVKTIHSELWDLLEETRGICARMLEAEECRTQLVENVVQLRDLFAMQFSLEEGLGYFSDPVYVEANVSRRASSLRDDHCFLYREIDRICEWLEDLRYNGGMKNELSNITVAFHSFYDQIQTHERKEQELIFDTYCNDIGTGD